MLKLIYFVPDSHLEVTKQAIFKAGAGNFNHYQHCAWQCKGMGQYMPIGQANPFLGTLEQLEQVEEWRVEVIVPKHLAKDVKQALLQSHPYEEVAYEFLMILDVDHL